MGQSPESLYQQRYNTFKALAGKYHSKDNQISIYRTLVFLAGAASVVYFFSSRSFYPLAISGGLFLLIFLILLRWHSKIKDKENRNKILADINKEELDVIKGNINGKPSGDRYLNREHPYAPDLDIFGSFSVFQLVNRTVTPEGEQLLADRLNKPLAQKEQIGDHQEAVQELSRDLNWMQEFYASRQLYNFKENGDERLLKWTQEKPFFTKNDIILVRALQLAIIAVVILAAADIITWKFFILAALVNLAIFSGWKKKVRKFFGDAVDNIEHLKAYRELFTYIESRNFTSRKCEDLKNTLIKGNGKASPLIRQLQIRLEYLESTDNAYFAVVANAFTLWDLHWVFRIEKWKKETEHDLEKWFQVVHEFEVLNSFSGYAFSNGEFTYPSVKEDFIIKADDLGHPLIFNGRITNDFEISGTGKSVILTGSNMSGKSTFLRTLGVNLVLGLNGAPICGQNVVLGPVKVFTSMRTMDSLEEHVSSFYAELKRLKQLLGYISESDQTVFYLLDEILKGTNSQDRHKGAKSFIRQLQEMNCSGIVATHDLELAEMEEETDNIRNYSFTSELRDGELYFDHKIKQGICKSFNATELMKKMGIGIS